MRRRAVSPLFADFLPWKWPESVFLVLNKRKADSGDEIGEGVDNSNLFHFRCVGHRSGDRCQIRKYLTLPCSLE